MASPQGRRLSARRGSSSAPDPFARHMSNGGQASSNSILTLFKVPAAVEPSNGHASRKRASSDMSNNRLSFAHSSFERARPGQRSPTSTSPTSSPRIRAHSGSRERPHSLSSSSKPSLSPDQLYELVKNNKNFRSRPQSPRLETASFTALAEHVYLPFVDRPAEIASLISTSPTARLFALLAQTFPKLTAPVDDRDPTTWGYKKLHHYLTSASRETDPDPTFVANVRRCILPHSELIWERIKGALGVPPELDYDDAGEISSDDGMRALGHWDGWDSAWDSPVHERRSYFPSAGEDTVSPTPQGTSSPTGPVTITTQAASPPLEDEPMDGSDEEVDTSLTVETLVASGSPTPISPRSPGLGLISEADEEEFAEAAESSPPAEEPIAGLRFRTASPMHKVHSPARMSSSVLSSLPSTFSDTSVSSMSDFGRSISPSHSLSRSPGSAMSHSPETPPQSIGKRLGHRSSFGSFASIHSLSVSDRGSVGGEGGYGGLERKAPLFVSSFAGMGARRRG
ncbi:hypothetical protein BD626DRAFT_216971 [Schizophyllum amplum]|uniref:Uncharacterized protein n=1 Tax=Schizophyllum amplum TaxID=97359 RepID=A0A550CKM0_9AGAR|nr:hypothetical protein BD626DRAFT_216971 [Auriculariopsis ampla]